jgi:hypothetical protein
VLRHPKTEQSMGEDARAYISVLLKFLPNFSFFSLSNFSEVLMSLPVIAVTNASTCLTDAQVGAVLPALQQQVIQDFRAYWELDCTLTFLAKDQPLSKGWWQIVVTDDPDQAGALGYHELTSGGAPLGKVFAGLDLRDGYSWTVTLSHELLEMLADPWIDWCAEGQDGKIYALEVCDAVEADALGYEIGGVLVSDFVTPAWFEPTDADCVDFKRRVAKPLELAPGGYISILDPAKGWTQITAEGNPGGPEAPMGSRRQRRGMGREQWRRSGSSKT